MSLNNQPDVTIVIPCYNCQDYIRSCIASVAEQKNVHYEIIAVDDGSQDTTWEILKSLAAELPMLQIERFSSNRGQAAARNVAMASARGRYIALLDSDDMYRTDNVLQRWVKIADDGRLDLCIAQYSIIETDGSIRPGPAVPQVRGEAGSAKDTPSIVNTQQSWQILFRRDFVERENLKFSQMLRQREDRLFFVEAFVKASRIGVADIDAVLYRVHPNSTMRQITYDQLSQFNVHMEIMREYLGDARALGRLHPDFERANAFAYWRQAVEYWNKLLAEAIPLIGQNLEAHQQHTAGLAAQFLRNIHELTRHCAPIYLDPHIVKGDHIERVKAEGVLDIARIAVETNRMDVLLRILDARRVHSTALLEMAQASQFDWALDAVHHYVKYGRCAEFPEERISTATPRLRSLVKRVILHIGMPKTGSSSMQEFFEDNRFKLLEKGIYYPVYGAFREHGIRRNRSSGHLALVRQAVNGMDSDVIEKRLAAEISSLNASVNTLVLSAENILSHVIWPVLAGEGREGADVISKISSALGVDSVEIAVVFRRQNDWFKSYYREVISNPFNEMVMSPVSFFKMLDSRGLFDYDSIASQLSNSPRVSRLHVQGFKQLRTAGGSIPWMLSIIGGDFSELTDGFRKQVNESFSDAAAANIRQLKLLRLNRKRAEDLFAQIVSEEYLRESSYSMISNSDWDLIDDKLASYYEAYDRRFPGERHNIRGQADEVYLPTLPGLTRIDPNYISLSGQERLSEISREHAYMKSSKSWKATAPLRSILLRIKGSEGIRRISLRRILRSRGSKP